MFASAFPPVENTIDSEHRTNLAEPRTLVIIQGEAMPIGETYPIIKL